MLKQSLALLVLVAAVALPPQADAAALDGYDAVAYFTVGKPVRGAKAVSHEFGGKTYYFSSARNRDAFAAAPEKYLPQYGGYCAWAVAQGELAPGDPAVAKVVNNKLYLNFNQEIAARWEKDIPGFIRAGNAHWPKIRK